MLDHLTQPLIKFFSNFLYYLLILGVLFSVFSFIYFGIKIIIEKKVNDFKRIILFVILGLTILGIILIDRKIIFDLINIFVPKF
jgi:Zn-dependent membrane protease YugP